MPQAACVLRAFVWSNLRWDACKPLPSIRFTGDISSNLCRAGATGMFCSLNACCKPRPASEAATTELGFTHWMLWSPYVLGTRTRLCFGHGCSGHRMFLEHERDYALGMDALVTVCSWNTNEIMLGAWMLWSPYALGTRTRLCFGHGCSGHRMLLEHERDYAWGMDALVTVCSWNTNEIMLWAWMLWSPYVFGTRTRLCFGHGCSGHRMFLEHERDYALGMDALVTVCFFEHERDYALGMDALVTVCSWNTFEIMFWAWMLWSPYALGTRTRLWFGHGCSGHHMFLKHERDYALGMDALVTVCSWNTNVIMKWAWMLWQSYALETRTLL